MRKLVVSEFVSLDGVMEDPGGAEGFEHGGWTGPYSSEEAGKLKFAELFASDALLLGRITYQGFAKAWPSMEGTGEFGERMNSLPKYVVSTTLTADGLTWNNSHLIKGNAAEQIARLKQQPGQDILVGGSGALTRTLLQHNLVDVLRLLVYPVALGSGKRLLEGGNKTPLNLLETKPLGAGIVLLEYQPAAAAST